MMSEFKVSLRAPIEYSRRKKNTESHPYRTDYMRDRDRLLYSKAFRRLSGKTQIFLSSYDDHARNRLTHTLEVAQLARTVAKRLDLDEDLTEAIALGHDLGHTPFGHAGERTLNKIMNGCYSFSKKVVFEESKGFKHNHQGVRVVVDLESQLNLTNHTVYGILSHTNLDWTKYNKNHQAVICSNYSSKDNTCKITSERCTNEGIHKVSFYDQYLNNNSFFNNAWSFEAFVVEICDEIAQRHHDIEDSLSTKLMSPKEVYELLKGLFDNFEDEIKFRQNTQSFQPEVARFLVDTYITNLIETSTTSLDCFIRRERVRKREDFFNIFDSLLVAKMKELINFNESLTNANKQLKRILKERVLLSNQVQRMDGRADYIIRKLFQAYLSNPQQLPDKTIYSLYTRLDSNSKNKNPKLLKPETFATKVSEMRSNIEKDYTDSGFKDILLRTICDYISGMTDKFTEQEFHKLYGMSASV